MGTLTIENGPDTTKATASISGTTLKITPKAAGTTSLTLKESNGNKTATINISVLATSITASPSSVTANLSDGNQTVTIGGTNRGTLSISSQPDSSIATASVSGSTLTITPKAKGTTSVTVKEANGNKTVTISIKVTEGVAAQEIPATEYGTVVRGYSCTNSSVVDYWKIFYADDNNVYLIADDYIPYDYIPPDALGIYLQEGYYPRSAYFTNILGSYSGSTSITDSRIQALNNSFYTQGYTSYENNMKSVAYMLDINSWSGYAGEHADYAIGGPTLELLFKSYNKKYQTNYVAEAKNLFGYQIGVGSASGEELILMITSDTTYVITDTTNAYGMWIASPYAGSSQAMYFQNRDGSIRATPYSRNRLWSNSKRI